MGRLWSSAVPNRHKLIRAPRLALIITLGCLSTSLFAGTPDWLKQAAQVSLASYPNDTAAVVLLDERLTTVSASGEVRTTYRKAYKILRPEGRDRGIVYVYFDSETRLTWLKAWSITSRNEEYEVKEKDAVETTVLSESLYADSRYKLLQIPASQPGSIIGYEYEQRQRPRVLQTIFPFQDNIPVRLARFTLELPSDWGYTGYWRNHVPVPPQQSGKNRWTWELQNIEPILSEPEMPEWRSLTGQFGLSFSPKTSVSPENNYWSWTQIGRWYADLTAGRRDATPAIRDKARELTAGVINPLEKIRRLAFFVQHGIRYVAIEIGVGGYQPHPATDVLASGYGDCKDKATLLGALLHEVGIDSYYVLINNERESLAPDFPTTLAFNHVILAIRLPSATSERALAVLSHKELGTLVFFDPTDDATAYGYLPPSLQSNFGLLVTAAGGELVKLPLLPASTSRVLRVAKLSLDNDGNLTGTVEEVRSGPAAAALREQLLNVPQIRRQDVFQNLLTELLDGAVLTSASMSMSHLKEFEGSLAVTYGLRARAYAQHAGDLFLFRRCVLGRKSSGILEGKPRKQPLVFSYPGSEGDVVSISFPEMYEIDDLPRSVKYEYPAAAYQSETRAEEHVLHYNRNYELKDVRVPLDGLQDLKTLFRDIADDERSYAILKRSMPDRSER